MLVYTPITIMRVKTIIYSSAVASLTLVGAASIISARDVVTQAQPVDSNINISPSTRASREAFDYSTTCSARFEAGFCRDNDIKLNNDTKCCRFRDQCGDLPRCDSTLCCQQINSRARATDSSTHRACSCMGGVINNRCYGKFKDAVKAARNEDTVHFGGDVIVKEPVYFGSNVKFQGEMCAGNRASLIAKFDSKKQAMLQATKSGQIVEFRDLDFTSQGINKAAAFHAGGEESDAGTQTIDAKFYNVHIHDMQSEALGVGIRVGNVLNLLIDADCKFQNLVQSSSEPDRFAGGSAVAVIYLPESSKMSISGMFIDNKSFYPGLGSNHAGGGAIYLDYLAGTVNIDAEFTGNESNEGGALKIQGVLGSTKISGLFKGNKGVDSGNGSRGGAIRVNKIFGTGVLEMDAHCMKNTTPGRGGVIASNVHNTGGKMTIKGLFQDNAAGTDGGVWSMWSTGTEFTAETIFEANSIINDNLAINDMRSSLYDVRDSMRHTRMSDRNWKIDQTVIVL